MKILTVCILLLSVALTALGQDYPENKNRAFQRVLKKQANSDEVKLREIPLPDSLYSSTFIYGDYYVAKTIVPFYVYVGRVNCCRAGGCDISNEKAGFEYFDYAIFFDLKGLVTKVKVFDYQATHGQEVCAPGWLKQFRHYDGQDELSVGKTIDAISGATISAIALTNDIAEKTRILQSHIIIQ